MNTPLPPIYCDIRRLLVLAEDVVRRFSRYHKLNESQGTKTMKPALMFCLTLCTGVQASGVAAQSRYTVSTDEQEVSDARTGLVWLRCAEGMTASGGTCTGSGSAFTHEAALQHAAAQAGSSGKAWRLPNIKELSSIADKSRSYPAIDTTAFPATPAAWFWSSSPSAGDSGGAWGVGFSNGSVYLKGRGSYDGHVRLVRAGQ